MDKETLYLGIPTIALGCSIFLGVVVSSLFGVSLLMAFFVSVVFTLLIICCTYFYRKKNSLLSAEEKEIEDIISASVRKGYHSIEEKISAIYWRFNYKPDYSNHSSNNTTHDYLAEWNIEIIRNIELKKFIDLCESFLILSGIKVKRTKSGVDRGVDLKIYKPSYSLTKPVAIGQCKVQYNSKIEVKYLMELIGIMADFEVNTSFFFTNSEFSQDAIEFAATNDVIRLFDGEKLLEKIKKLPEQKRQFLFDKIIGDK